MVLSPKWVNEQIVMQIWHSVQSERLSFIIGNLSRYFRPITRYVIAIPAKPKAGQTVKHLCNPKKAMRLPDSRIRDKDRMIDIRWSFL